MKNFNAILFLSGILSVLFPAYAQEEFITQFEKSQGHKTATYFECIDYYLRLAKQYESIHIQEFGMTDSGYPLHIVLFNVDMDFDYENTSNLKILVINAIHPGEPAGVDASMILLRDLASGIISTNISKDILLLYSKNSTINNTITPKNP